MSRTYLKGPNHLDDLINLIEQEKNLLFKCQEHI